MTFQNQIQNYTQTISSTDNITQWLTDGAKLLVGVIPERKLRLYEVSNTDSGSGVSLSGKRFVRAMKTLYDAPLVNENIASLSDISSIFYADARSPKCYILAGTAFVKPTGGEVYAIAYPTVAYGDSTISGFPSELIPGVVIYASQRALYSEIKSIITSIASLTLSTATLPDSPTDTVTIGSLPTAPVYTAPTGSYLDDFTDAETRLSNDDLELAGGELNKLQVQLEKYSREQQDSNAKFQENMALYQAELQKLFKQADLDQQLILSKYSEDLQRYSSAINANSQTFQSSLGKLTNQINAIKLQIDVLNADYENVIKLYLSNV